MKLEEEIREKKKEYRTDSYAMSYGEIISMYRNGEIDINPEFQRYYRWSLSQKTVTIQRKYFRIYLTLNVRKSGILYG